MTHNHLKLKIQLQKYLDDSEKFENKGNQAAGKRLVKTLEEIAELANSRRAEVQTKLKK